VATGDRVVWRLFEPIHIVTYFAAESRQRFLDAGLRGFWRGYFAGRAAPLGAVSAAAVVASFFSFAPPMVARALPAVWTMVRPDDALAARVEGATASLAVLLDGVAESDVLVAAALLEEAVGSLEPAGRVLGAANAAIAPYERPLARLWQATTTLREYRGDGHNAALVAAGLGPCEVLALRCGIDLSRASVQPARGWTDDEWTGAQQSLAARGLLDQDGRGTAAGVDLMAAVEAATDLAAAKPVRALGPAAVTRLTGLLEPMARVCQAASPAAVALGLPLPATTA
jgi:hypothetical protein